MIDEKFLRAYHDIREKAWDTDQCDEICINPDDATQLEKRLIELGATTVGNSLSFVRISTNK